MTAGESDPTHNHLIIVIMSFHSLVSGRGGLRRVQGSPESRRDEFQAREK